MGVRILVGYEQGDHDKVNEQALLVDWTTGIPLMTEMFHGDEATGASAEDEAQAFLDWLKTKHGVEDPRAISDPTWLLRRQTEWLRTERR